MEKIIRNTTHTNKDDNQQIFVIESYNARLCQYNNVARLEYPNDMLEAWSMLLESVSQLHYMHMEEQ